MIGRVFQIRRAFIHSEAYASTHYAVRFRLFSFHSSFYLASSPVAGIRIEIAGATQLDSLKELLGA